MVVRVPAPNKLKTTQSCSYDTATKPRSRLKHDYDNHMKHYETQSLHPTWAGCLISTTSLPSLVRAHSNPPKPSPQKPTVPQRNDLTTNKPKPTPFDSCYKCLPFPAHVPTRDRGNSDRNPVPRVKSLSELMDVSLPLPRNHLFERGFLLTHLINKKQFGKPSGQNSG